MARPKKVGRDEKAALEAALQDVPGNLPFYLGALTTAGHLHAAGYAVTEDQVDEAGLPGRALIFCPVLLDDGGHIDAMIEVRMNVLFTLQQAASEAGVSYRTVQRWRDEGRLFVIERDGRQFFPSGPFKEFLRAQRKK